jgi:hypothetical protein
MRLNDKSQWTLELAKMVMDSDPGVKGMEQIKLVIAHESPLFMAIRSFDVMSHWLLGDNCATKEPRHPLPGSRVMAAALTERRRVFIPPRLKSCSESLIWVLSETGKAESTSVFSIDCETF